MTDRLRSTTARFLDDANGGPLAEFAMVVPLLCILLAGIIDFGGLIYQRHAIIKGVQDAARYASRHPTIVMGAECPPVHDGWNQTVVDAAYIAVHGSASENNRLLRNFTEDKISVTVDCMAGQGLYLPNSNIDSIAVVTVSASVPAVSIGLFAAIGLENLVISAQHQEMGLGL